MAKAEAGESSRRALNWDALAAIVASLIGLVALVVAGYTAYIQREQVRAQVWPYLIGGSSSASNDIIWINKGVGPAIIRSVEVGFDGRAQQDWSSLLGTMEPRPEGWHQSFLAGNVVSAGETVTWLHFSNRSDFDRFMTHGKQDGFRVELCYCSTLGDCWRTQWNQSAREAVPDCPAVPESRQFRD